jgi:hypothetical protein
MDDFDEYIAFLFSGITSEDLEFGLSDGLFQLPNLQKHN